MHAVQQIDARTTGAVGTPVSSIVKFYGRNTDVSQNDPAYAATVESLLSVTGNITESSKRFKEDPSWKNLESDMAMLTNYVLHPEGKIRRYQVELTAQVLIPYLSKMKEQWHVDEQRFRQLGQIIQALVVRDECEHPATCLLALDEVTMEINNKKSYMFRSELLSLLQTATAKQWQPIVTDMRQLLQNIGGKFLFLGLIGVIGWPVALLYPLFRVAQTLLRVTNEWEHSKRLSPETLLELGKTAVIIYASMQVVSILAIYTSLGYFCCITAAAALTVSSSTALIKQVTPIIAPLTTVIDMFLRQIDSIDHKKISQTINQQLHAAGVTGQSQHASSSSIHDGVSSARVEELPDAVGTETNSNNNSSSSSSEAIPIASVMHTVGAAAQHMGYPGYPGYTFVEASPASASDPRDPCWDSQPVADSGYGLRRRSAH